MAASDKTYRNQKALDVVFGVSSLALLVSMIWMFVQDYNRPWKAEQRAFRDVEAAMFTWQTVSSLPDLEKLKEIRGRLKEAREGLSETKPITVKRQDGSPEEVNGLSRKQAVERLDEEAARLR